LFTEADVVLRLGRLAVVAALALGVLTDGVWARAQATRPLRSEKTVHFKTDQVIDLQMAAGPVTIRSVKFSSNMAQGMSARFKPGGAPDTQTTLRASFDVENPDKDEWVVTFALEYLDSKGKLIDHGSKGSSWEGEAKFFNFDHSILSYAIQFIDQVKISVSGKLD
jgi:hypothetical protein